jgi:Fe-S-cluster-containing hydrogenase component 2
LKIRRDASRCHGCRACEIMCSFHHRGCIVPAASSITVVRDNATGGVRWSVDDTCDSCKGEERPFCETYCLYEALKVEEA